MRARKIGLFLVFILVIAISINEIKALTYDCDFRARTSCLTPPWNNIVMKISNETNAHGEIWSENHYDYVICCNFTGSRDCSVLLDTNNILKLSDTKNAHAEVAVFNNYPVEVCYGNVTCINTPSGCGSAFPIDMFSLSSTTNAHISLYNSDGYNTNICCKNVNEPTPGGTVCGDYPNSDICNPPATICNESYVYADDTNYCCPHQCTTCKDTAEACAGRQCGTAPDGCGNLLSCGTCPPDYNCSEEIGLCTSGVSCNDPVYASWNTNYSVHGEKVFLKVYASRLCAGESVSFYVEENDGLAGTEPIPPGSLQPDPIRFNALGLAEGNWTAAYQDDEVGLPEYIFNATFTNDSGSTFWIDSGHTNGPAAIKELEVNLIDCTDIMTCNDYDTSDLCQANPCEFLNNILANSEAALPHLCGYDHCENGFWFDNCNRCTWKENTGTCTFGVPKICGGSNENDSVGFYCYEGDATTKQCDVPPVGIYTSSWNGIMMWDLNNGWATKDDCKAAITGATDLDCILDSDDGLYHYYPGGDISWCEDGSITLECPSEIRLPFFGTYGFVATLLVILGVYLILIKSKRIKVL